MAQLMNIFAAKTPPDNTINRIEALEKKVTDLLNRPVPEPQIIHQTVQNVKQVTEEAPVQAAPAGPIIDQASLDKIDDLLRRVQGLETRADKTDRHQDQQDETLTDHERRIKALEAMDLSAAVPPTATGEVDTAAILKQVNIVKAEVS